MMLKYMNMLNILKERQLYEAMIIFMRQVNSVSDIKLNSYSSLVHFIALLQFEVFEKM